MSDLAEALRQAGGMLAGKEPEVWRIAGLSVVLSVSATAGACLAALPLASALSGTRFRGRRLVDALLSAGMAFPTVLVGLVLFALFARQGPLGTFQLLYTPVLMGIGQFLLALPICLVLMLTALEAVDPRARESALLLGATLAQARRAVRREARAGILVALVAAFSRVITEVGCALIVGGDIRGKTRVLTTAIAGDTRTGDFARALALGAILLIVALAVNLAAALLPRRRR